jgi:hypothetical protein
MTTIFLLVAVVFVLSLVPLVLLGVRTWMTHRGARVVTCPEARGPAAVKLDIVHATGSAARGELELRIRSCSGWPERRQCGQTCLAELAAAPAECVVRTTLVDWYRGGTCAVCGGGIGEVHWVEHEPALLTPGRETVEWRDVSPENLAAVLATHRRVCWKCHASRALRQRLPGFVVEEPEPGPGRA